MGIPHKVYDCIVVGAGHAGTEAALAVARGGFETLLLTINLDTICQMSCNPAIGGLAKGHIVREIDALGGQMAKTTDKTALQFHMLNRSKGPAVWAPRAQADKKAYQFYMKHQVELAPHLDAKQDQAAEVLVEGGRAIGVKTLLGIAYYGRTVVLTTGTFMKGLIHIGDVTQRGGRGGESASMVLSDNLRALGFEVSRFKTGTPPRLHRKSIDYSDLELQRGDTDPEPFSFQTERLQVEQLPCHITYTNERTHEIIRQNLHRSPLYGGKIKSIGPRYCPSIEDKVVKFAEKTRHQLFLEPEGYHTEEIYVNGLSTSLPFDVQYDIVRSIKGLERAEIMRFAYAIEYDYTPPTQVKHSMETKLIRGLFFAGQINGTTGYEEAAAQGLLAGLNVIRQLRGEEPFVLDRSEAYIGVLIDDLVTKGTTEPYRMFTSRAEFRLLLRQDNADDRLMKYGYEFGLIPEEAFQKWIRQKRAVDEEVERLKKTYHRTVLLAKTLRQPEVQYRDLPDKTSRELGRLSRDEIRKVEITIKYEGYIARQLAQVQDFKRIEQKRIPTGIDFSSVRGLRREAQEKFARTQPDSIGQAARIPGVTTCDVSVLLIHLRRLEAPALHS